MSKERLEEIEAIEEEMGNGFAIEDLDLNTMTVVNREHFNWLIEQSERNVTAQETVEILGESLKQSIEQNKRYRELLESIRYTQDVAKEIQAEKPNIKVITPDDLLQHMLRKVNKELESELE